MTPGQKERAGEGERAQSGAQDESSPTFSYFILLDYYCLYTNKQTARMAGTTTTMTTTRDGARDADASRAPGRLYICVY